MKGKHREQPEPDEYKHQRNRQSQDLQEMEKDRWAGVLLLNHAGDSKPSDHRENNCERCSRQPNPAKYDAAEQEQQEFSRGVSSLRRG